ncbi:fimbria/pilus outer membrane usher protein [Obesumbacterium proteus]|uniref:fimbria/pilus outer membrane usher protein n=1 Tax=Obesumbacterium proteus TaxID=82983 RepID=UPI002432D121|nr:fimbrial biogenesis outer membrane usher protein [Obesumbacterium proteus]
MTTRYKSENFIFSLSIIAFCIHPAHAGEYFDAGLLSIGQSDAQPVDLSHFEKSGAIAPGIYNLDVFINGDEYGYTDIEVTELENGTVAPVITPALLKKLHVNVDGISGLKGRVPDEKITDIGSIIPQASARIELKKLSLYIRIPQADMDLNAAGYVNPELLDVGIPGLMLNYSANANRMWSKNSQINSNLYSGINGGLNIGPWRLRSNYTYNYSQNGKRSYNNSDVNSTRISRTILPLEAELAIGEVNTSSDVFDSFPARAVMLSSLEQMKPYSMRGFAPLISGNAETNARVTVLQNNNIVYQTYVSPGPFIINDLYQTAIGSDLIVMIREADGRVRTQQIAYSSLPNMLRQGAWKYQLAAGEYNNHSQPWSDAARFSQGTLSYGLPHNVTLYGGLLVSEDYYSGVLGAGLSLGRFGALSTDVTQSTISDKNRHLSGQSYRLRYSKSITETGTSVDLTAYRYSTKNYYNFADFNRRSYHSEPDDYPWATDRRRSSFQTRISQDFQQYGSFSISASRDDYWKSKTVNNNLSASYNVNLYQINLGVGYSIDRIKRDNSWPENHTLYANIQIPFNVFDRDSANSAYVRYMMSKDDNGRMQQQASYSGTLMNNRLSYNAQQSWSNGENDPAISGLNFSYQGSQGLASVGYSHSEQWQSLNLGLNGGLVAHAGGVTLSQTLGSSVALVDAPGAVNTSVINGNVKTNSSGYAVVPFLSDFQKNTVILDPSTLPSNVELQKNSLNVYPVKDSIVRANFNTRYGEQAIFSLKDMQGHYLPFGAMATIIGESDNGDNMFIVGDNGQVYFTGLQPTGSIQIKWGYEMSQQCQTDYLLATNISKQSITHQELTCK